MTLIEQYLQKIPEHAQRKTMHEFLKIWQECIADSPTGIRAQSTGRFCAMQFLREQSE